VSGLTDAQLAVRREGIGGSELSAILGISPFSGPLEVFNSKTYGSHFEANDAMKVGTMAEAPLARIVGEMEGRLLRPGHEFQIPANDPLGPHEQLGERSFDATRAAYLVDGTFQNTAYPRVLVTPDYIDAGYTCAYELKCVGKWSGANTFSKPGEPVRYPEYYARQAQMQAWTLNLIRAKLAVAVQPRKLEADLVAELWESWQGGDRDEVDFWFSLYLRHDCDVRIFNVPVSYARAEEDARFAQGWYDKYVLRGRPSRHWKPFARPGFYRATNK
jgi:hypothetical protein